MSIIIALRNLLHLKPRDKLGVRWRIRKGTADSKYEIDD